MPKCPSICRPGHPHVACCTKSHAMSTTDDGRSDGHGPVFMGLYVRLLVRYLRLDEAWLLASLRDDGIRIERYASPVFLDPHPAYSPRD
jgi:hypothetical protein